MSPEDETIAPDPLAVAVAGWLEALKQEQPPFDPDVWQRLQATVPDLLARLAAAH